MDDSIKVIVGKGDASFTMDRTPHLLINRLRDKKDKLRNQIVPSLWLPIVRHFIQTRLSGNATHELEFTGKDSLSAILTEVYPSFAEKEAEPDKITLKKYYSPLEDRILYIKAHPWTEWSRANITDEDMGISVGERVTGVNPLVGIVYAASTIVGESAEDDGSPKQTSLVYGYNALARRILQGDASERPSPFVGIVMTPPEKPDQYMGKLNASHPVVAEVSSWMAGQSSTTGPMTLYQWLLNHVMNSEDIDGRSTLEAVVADLLGIKNIKDRWYPDQLDIPVHKLVKEWSAKIKPSGVRSVRITKRDVTSDMFIQKIREDITFENFNEEYPNAFEFQKDTMEEISGATQPPPDVLQGVAVPTLDVPLVEFNKQLISAILDSLDTIESVVEEKKADNESLTIMTDQLAKLKIRIANLTSVGSSIDASKTDSYDVHFTSETIGGILPLMHHLHHQPNVTGKHHIYGDVHKTMERYHDLGLECY